MTTNFLNKLGRYMHALQLTILLSCLFFAGCDDSQSTQRKKTDGSDTASNTPTSETTGQPQAEMTAQAALAKFVSIAKDYSKKTVEGTCKAQGRSFDCGSTFTGGWSNTFGVDDVFIEMASVATSKASLREDIRALVEKHAAADVSAEDIKKLVKVEVPDFNAKSLAFKVNIPEPIDDTSCSLNGNVLTIIRRHSIFGFKTSKKVIYDMQKNSFVITSTNDIKQKKVVEFNVDISNHTCTAKSYPVDKTSQSDEDSTVLENCKMVKAPLTGDERATQ